MSIMIFLALLSMIMSQDTTMSKTLTSNHYTFERANPEAVAFQAKHFANLEKHLQQSGSSSMMLIYDGKVIFEYGDTHKKHLVHSIRKALLNSLYGIAISQNLIDTNKTLKALNIDDIHPLSDNEKSARIVDLLKSRSGVYHSAAATNEGMLKMIQERDSHKAGTHYYYNNWDFNVLGKILENETGKSIYELFKTQIAIPTGMNDYMGVNSSIDGESNEAEIPNNDGFYQFEKSKSKYPAYHFRLSTYDLAIYGQLYLNEGRWANKEIIPKAWIDASTKPYSLYNKYVGIAYGMLWNVLIPNKNRKSKSFYHTGVGIHMLGIYPKSKLVLVHRVDTEKAYSYKEEDFYKMISLVFKAID